MKKILITGANSYIGTSVEKYLQQWPEEYKVDTLDMIGDKWREYNFAGYDVVFHVAGIAHIKETTENAHLYYEVNRDLAVATAKKAKQEGVGQFIFLSTASVFGLTKGIITKSTPLRPTTHYGKAKKEAEEQMLLFSSEDFKLAIVRPLMVYGEGCKGNYQVLKKLALMLPIFPLVDNKRSLIHIDVLAKFIKKIIDRNSEGIFHPANSKPVNTSQMVYDIAKENGREIYLTRTFNWVLPIFCLFTDKVDKAFGTLVYDLCD